MGSSGGKIRRIERTRQSCLDESDGDIALDTSFLEELIIDGAVET